MAKSKGRTRLNMLIKKFLVKRRKSSPGGGWAEVQAGDMFGLMCILRELLDLKFERDADGDLPVNHTLIDRTRFEPLGYFPVPYEHKDAEGHFEAVVSNLRMASEAMKRAIDLRRMQRRHE